MNKKFNIYYANHGKRDGVEDFIFLLKSIFEQRGGEVNVSDKLDENSINIIIDEFTNYICNEEIKFFKKNNPEVKLVFVLTEFIESRLLINSFNFFGGLMVATPLAAMNIVFRLYRGDFKRPKIRDWMVAIIYSPLMVAYILAHLIRKISSKENIRLSAKLHRLAYMHMRYLGLESMIQYADYVILSHNMIEKGINKVSKDVNVTGTICPEMDFKDIETSLFDKKKLHIEITGSITPYRQGFIETINSSIIFLGIKNMVGLCQTISFSSGNIYPARAAYSLHPPQTKKWKYSSPTRIYRALQYDHNMPILTKVFNQHPIEKICLVYKGRDTLLEMYNYYRNPGQLKKLLKKRVGEYMEIAKIENNKIYNKIIEDKNKAEVN